MPAGWRWGVVDLPAPTLVLRRGNVSRKSGTWQDEDYDLFDGEQCVGRVYQVNDRPGRGKWFWGVSFQLTGRRSYGYVPSLAAAKAAIGAEYKRWQSGG